MQAISAVNEGPRLTPEELSAMLHKVLHPTAYDLEKKPEEPKTKPKADRRKAEK